MVVEIGAVRHRGGEEACQVARPARHLEPLDVPEVDVARREARREEHPGVGGARGPGGSSDVLRILMSFGGTTVIVTDAEAPVAVVAVIVAVPGSGSSQAKVERALRRGGQPAEAVQSTASPPTSK